MSFRKQGKDKFQRGNYKKAGSGGGNSGSFQGGKGDGKGGKGGKGDGAAGGDSKGWERSQGEKDQYVKDKRKAAGELDKRFGYALHEGGPPRLGWLFNMAPTAIEEGGVELAAVDLYFLEQDASTFKATYVYEPYFYVGLADARFAADVTSLLKRRFDSVPMIVDSVDKEDLELANHLAGHRRKYLRLKFNNVGDMMEVRKKLAPLVAANHEALQKQGAYSGGAGKKGGSAAGSAGKMGAGVGGGFLDTSGLAAAGPEDVMDLLTELREFDVAYSMRASIDLDLRCGTWYVVHAPGGGASGRNTGKVSEADLAAVNGQGSEAKELGAAAASAKPGAAVHPRSCSLEWQTELLIKAEPRILAFDIECTKEPLKFPQAERDQIFMISYMVDTQGYLIISREVVGEDIDNFEYTPKPGMDGPFHVFNERDEASALRRFFAHVQEVRPQIFVTYNGDFFDWPFIEKRAAVHGLNMAQEIGVSEQREGGYRGVCSLHLDCMAWVNRDSYLPQGSRSLKAVAKAKLGYDPVEVDPEDMVRFARERPAHMASYSVSDAVATYYLYTKYIHDFIFALCTIIPLGPEDVLNKGSGTLCESLLMIEAYKKNIICPNKQVDPLASFHQGHLLETETYVGGHVEALETGIYRADFDYAFKVDPATVQRLIDSVDKDLTFALEVEEGVDRSAVTNFDAVKGAIVEQLESLRDCPSRMEKPLIYHLDVAAMYPNIILTNRLQPSSMKTKEDCAACDFNAEDAPCKRPMDWVWRGDYLPATQSEYQMVKTQLMYEQVEGTPFGELSAADQAAKVKKRLKGYSQKVYKKSKSTTEAKRSDVVCMREDPFYVDTVKNFRDRRYDFKKLTKVWKGNVKKAKDSGDTIGARQAADRETLYDSLQLAHKCILNSFYGYVMRRGARWRSMEMAGIVTHTGAELIKQARELVENIGRPLELDTDGIWCILPASFPEDFTFTKADGKTVGISYPCVMLNAQVHDKFTNHQYQDLKDPAQRKWSTKSECSIFFEVDGPYRAMILPASTEEGKLLKKRYAVFEHDGSLAELKGFELKRRGELEVIKAFQEQVFSRFLEGDSLVSCYAAVGQVANNWLDVIDTRGEAIDDAELIDLISENKTISGLVSDYGDQKFTSLTTAARLGDYLGGEMLQDKGLNCRLVIANRPYGAPVTDRAIPTVIFKAEPAVREFWLRKWLKTSSSVDLRDVVDWVYYRERLSKTIQKIITIPAALQRVPNPVPRVAHPEWLIRVVKAQNAKHAQTKISDVFKGLGKGQVYVPKEVADLEDMGAPHGAGGVAGNARKGTAVVTKRGKIAQGASGDSGAMDADTNGDNADENGDDGNAPVTIEAEETPCPDQRADYQGWLAHRKRQWRQMRTEKAASRAAALRASGGRSLAGKGSTSAAVHAAAALASAARETAGHLGKPSKGLGIGDLVAAGQRGITHGIWQVIEVEATSTPGSFNVWAMTSARTLQRIPLEVNKVLYLNSRVEGLGGADFAAAFGARKVSKLLPRSVPSMHLFELTLAERRFARNEKLLTNLASHSDIQGVYESATPAWFRALLGLGCVSSLSPQRRRAEEELAGRRSRLTLRQRQQAAKDDKAGTEDLPPLTLGDTALVSTSAHPYLHPSVASFKRIFLYHSHAEEGNTDRSVTALFFIDSGGVPGASVDAAAAFTEPDMPLRCDEEGRLLYPSARCAVWVSNPFKQKEARPPMKRLLKELLEQELGIGSMPIEFSVEYTKSPSESFKRCSEALRAYTLERHGPTVVIAQTPWSTLGQIGSSSLRKKCPALASDFAIVPAPAHRGDQRYPSLQWSVHCAATALRRYAQVPHWLREQLQCARYAQVPLANLGEDSAVMMMDVCFGRLMQRNRHVLWASEGGSPDLGGIEGDENDLWADDDSNESVRSPGAHRSVCVQLDLLNLCVDAVVASSALDALDGTQGIGAMDVTHSGAATKQGQDLFGNSGASGDGEGGDVDMAQQQVSFGGAIGDGAACAAAFRVVKAMASSWLADVAATGSRLADNLLLHLHRYLGARESLLHDPALKRVVTSLMRKVFLRLVSEFQRLGATVVFADFGRVIIATGKDDPQAAVDYVKFVVDTITAHPVFEFIHLEPTKYWASLLFLDEQNYGGIELDFSALSSHADETSSSSSSVGAASAAVSSAPSFKAPGSDGKKVARSSGKGSDDGNAGSGEEAPWMGSPVGGDGDDDDDDDIDAMARGRRRKGAAVDKSLGGDAEEAFGDSDASGGEEVTVVQRTPFKASVLLSPAARRRKSQVLADSDDDADAGGSALDDDDHVASQGQGAASKFRGKNNSPGADIDDGGGEAADAYDDEEEGDGGGPRFDSRWDLAEYLPEQCREFFLIAVGMFLYRPLEKRKHQAEARDARLKAISDAIASQQQSKRVSLDGLLSPGASIPGLSQGFTPTQGDLSSQAVSSLTQRGEEDDEAAMQDFMKGLVSKTIARLLMRGVEDIAQYKASVAAFPDRPGSKRSDLHSPALEFAKAVCRVLSLDPGVAEEVQRLRRTLLAQVGVREFANEATFTDLGSTFVLPEVVCGQCNSSRDLDLCRDPSMTRPVEHERWLCDQCHAPYDKDKVELRLVESLQRRSTRFQLQDLRCVKCKQVAKRQMGVHCHCSGVLACDDTAEAFASDLATVAKLAAFHGFDWLQEVAASLGR